MKAVIQFGGVQHVVSKGDKIQVSSKSAEKTISLNPLMIIADKNNVGKPEVKGASVSLKFVEDIRAKKVTAIRYKAKKRVDIRKGHKQPLKVYEITDIKTS